MAKPFFTDPATNDYLQRQQQEADRLNKQAEQNAANADRANQDQQRLAEQTQRETERATAAQQKEALRAQNVQTETALQQQNRPQFTDSAGVIRPQQDDATFAAEQATKTQAKADAARFQQEGRKFAKNPIDGSTIPLQSDAALAAKKAADAEKTRRSLIDRQLAGLRTETQNPDFAKSRLSPEALTKAETALAKKKQEARDALIAKTSQQAEAQTGTSDWVPFNEEPAPEAEAAKAKLARLQDPNADLTDEDLAELESDPIFKSTTAAVRNLSTRVNKAKEAKDYLEPRERAIWEQEMRRDNPEQYREIMREKLATDPAALEQASTDFQTRRQQAEATVAGIQHKRQDTEAQLATIDQQNADALAAGVPAADLIHLEGPDGTPQPWSKALAAKRAEVSTLHQAWESEQEPVLAELDSEQQDLNATAAILNEAQTKRQQDGEAKRKQTLDALATQPGGKALAAGITQLDQERAQRTAALPAAGPEREAAAAALESDLQAKATALQDQAAAERVAASKFYRHLKEFSPETDWSKPYPALAQVLRNASAKAGIDPETAKQYLPSFAERDWTAGDKEATSRLTSDGQLLINPTLAMDEKAYTQAVADAKATPEQKKAALAELPKAQSDLAAASVGVLSIMDDNPTFAAATGSGAGFVKALENPTALARFLGGALTGLAPTAVPSFNQFVEFIDSKQPGFAAKAPSEQAAAYLKAVGQTRGVLDKYKDQILSGLISGTAAIPQQIAGAYAALTGNADAAQFASDLTAVAGIDQQRLELTGSNDAPGARFAGSIASTIPSLALAIGGGIVTQGLTRVGLAFSGVKTPAQAMAALETAGITGSSLAGGAQSAGGFYADAYNTFTAQGMPHAEAHKAAQMPAMLAGLGTALLTLAGGKTGIESLFAAKGGAEAAKALVRTRFQNITRGFLKEGASEGLEEGFDQLWQGFLDQAAVHPDKTVGEIFSEALEAGAIGGLLGGAIGGAIGGVQGAGVSTEPPPAPVNPANLPETVEGAETAIDTLDIPDLDPQTLARTQDAARSVLYIAQGTQLTDLPADSLAALDVVEDPKNPGQFINGKIVAGKDGATKLVTYAGGQVSDPATGALRPVRVRIENGQPIISQATLDKLETILPAVRAAIPLNETDRRTQVRSPAPQPAPDATQNSVQSASGSGNPQTPSDPATSPAQAPVEGQTSNVLPPEAEDRSNQLSLHLTELGLPPAQAEAVAQAMVAKRGVVGTDYTEQVVSKEFSADLKALGISGSLSSVKAKENPLKAGPDLAQRLASYSPPLPVSSSPSLSPSAPVTPPPAIPPVPTGTTSDSSNPAQGAATPAQGGVDSPQGEAPATLADASPAGIDSDAYLTARQAAMKATPVAKRKDAVKLLGALDKAINRYGSAFAGVRFVTTPGGGLAVNRAGGKTYLDIDLGQWVSQHTTLVDKAGVVALTELEEEFIHKAASSIFTDADMRGFFRSLPADLQRMVYKGYHVADIASKTLPAEPPAQFEDVQAVQLGHEFLRMLVQDTTFNGRVSEAIAADPGLGQKIIDFLQKLVSNLRKLIDKADTDTRVTIAEYEKRVTNEVNRLKKLLPDPLRAKETPVNLAATQDNRASVSQSPSPQVSESPALAPVLGSTYTAYTDSNDPIDVQWAVVDVNSLTLSNEDDGRINPAYPQELQPRDRTSAGSEAQVADIAKNFNLDRLSASNGVGDGAPIIGPDGIVESGNGRGMGARRAYLSKSPSLQGSSSSYRTSLINRAQEFGLNTEQVEAVSNPVLVRIRRTDVNRPAFVLAANVSTIAPKRDIEQAKIDAGQIVPDLFESYVPSEDGDIFTAANADFIKGYISAVIPPAERPAVIDARGNLSQSGLRRIRNALFVHAYGKSPEALNALARLTESVDAADTNIARALIALAPRFGEQNARIAAGALQPVSITDELTAALQILSDLKNRGEKVSDWLAQDRIPGIGEDPGPVGTALVEYLHENRQRPRQIIDTLTRYASAVDAAGDPRQMSMFDDEKPTKATLWARSAEAAQPALAKSTVAPEPGFVLFENSLGIARAEMPQVPTAARGALAQFLVGQGIRIKPETVAADSLKPTQAEYSPEKVIKSRQHIDSRRLLVSADNYVLDGHHQWQAAREDGADVPIFRLDAQVNEALAALDAFPSTTGGKPTGTRYETEEYRYLGTATEDWRKATHPEAGIVNPINPDLSPDAKVDALNALSRQNIPIVEDILDTINRALRIEGKHSVKMPERIQAKASRPSIRAEKPWHDIEHVRDGLRFKVKMTDFKQAPRIMAVLLQKGAKVIKLDTTKMISPKAWGWRFVAWDLQMPNGQLVEFYSPLPELDSKTVKRPNHDLFEKWRNAKEEDYRDNPEYWDDIRTSKARYDDAYRAAITRMGYADEAAAEADWTRLETVLTSLMNAKRSAASTGEGAPRTQSAPGFRRNPPTPGTNTATSPSSDSMATGSDLEGFFTWEDSTDSDGKQPVSLAKSKVSPDAGPDLFGFNTGMGLDALLTPAQKEAKVQQAQTLDLFGGLTNEKPRPPAQRPARPVTPPKRQPAPQPEADGFGELFAQPGLAGGNAGGRPTGLTGGTGTGGNDNAGGELALDADTQPADNAGGSTGSSGTRRPRRPQGNDANPRVERPALDSPARNFAPPADLASLAPIGNKTKIQANLAAIRLLKTLETEERNATPEEKRALAAYTGWGAFKEAFNDGMADAVESWKGRPFYSQQYKPAFVTTWEKNYGELHAILKAELSEDEYRAASRSTLNAHYTAAPVIRAMWKMVDRLGFKGGRALEPSAGNGHYIGLQPAGDSADRTQWQAVELDDLSAKMLAKLYPEATVNERLGGNEGRSMDGLGFERARIPNGSLDLVISNVPFHESGPRKKGFPNLNLHNFFFAHALDKVKPGGLVAFITSASTMQNNQKQRDFIASKGDLVAAVRMPNNAFKENAGTEVVTDILIFRKPDGTPFKGQPWRNLVEVGRQTITLTQGKDQLADDLRREAKTNGTILREYLKDGIKAIDVDAPIMVNEYFAANPGNVLGQHSLQGSMYRGNEYTVTAPSDFDVGEALDRLVSTMPENVMGQQEAAGTNSALADRSDRPFSFIERDGKVYEVQDDGTMLEPDWVTNPAMVKTFRSWLRVREAARALIQAENSAGTEDTDLDPLRKALNLAYDTHVATHGAISKRHANKHSHLYSDPEYPLTAALENEKVSIDTKTGKKTYTYGKAAIMKQRVVRPIAPPTKAANFAEALQMSLAWRGMINPRFMADLLGVDFEEVMSMADADPGVFLDPGSSNYETAESYLVGNVRRKLDEAEAAAEDDPQFRKNVEALRAVQPEYRGIGSIDAALGERWIPAEVYGAFINEVLQGSDTVEYVPAGNMFRIAGTHLYRNPEFASKKMGSAELLDTLLSLQEPMIYYKDSEGRSHFDATNTAAAKAAAVKMKRAFAEFVKTSETPLTLVPDAEPIPVWKSVEIAYNDTLNNFVTPKQTGEYLQFPGLSEDVWRTAHRRAVIARFLAERRGMMAHGVGSGKTFNQIILAQELRRLGLAKKPLIVVQNSTLGQFAASYLKAYPAAKILVPTERDLQTQNRRKLVSKIATGDYDAVILSHSQFDLISNKPESVKAYMGEKIDELKALIIAEKGGDKSKVRDLEGMLKRLEDRLSSMLTGLGERQDSTIYFEDLGVDALIVDEAHNYKSVPIVTRMGRVKGVPSGADSQRAIGMLLKARHVQSKTGGKNVFLATGTPVKNSMAEAYIMMEIMAPDVLRDYKIYNFDDFATSYGEITSSTEISWSGQPKVESRFAKFKKGRELITMIRTVFDVAMGNETLGLKVPKVKGGAPSLDIVPVTPTIERFNAWVRDLAKGWSQASGKDKEEFTAVPIMTLQAGIAAALDPRLLAPNAPDHAESKVNMAVREMLRLYKSGTPKKTTQLVFADLRRPFNMDYLERFMTIVRADEQALLNSISAETKKEMGLDDTVKHPHPFHEFRGDKSDFDLYEDLKKKLIAGGVKESEILVMDPSMSKAKRTAMFEKVSSGEIRIAIGSTETLGVGVNVQERIVALHHLMPPRDFTPAMHEQRNGRAIRQGNLHHEWDEEIEIHQWGTEGSMDSAVYATLGRKQRFITQLLMGEIGSDTFDDPTDPIAVNLAEMAARTMGDPDFIRRIEIEKELRDLRLESEAFTSETASRRSRLNSSEMMVRSLPAEIEKLKGISTVLNTVWQRTAPRPEGVRETTDISDKPVYEFGDKVIDTAGKEGGITVPLDLWLANESSTMEHRGLKQSLPMPFKVNGVEFGVSVETTMPGSKTPGTVKLAGGEGNGATFSGAEGLIRVLREAPRNYQDTIARRESALTTARADAEKLRALIDRDTTFSRAGELATLEQELIDLDARIAEKATPTPPPGGDSQQADLTLPPMSPVDPKLMTDAVRDVLEQGWVMTDRVFLPDDLDRKLYQQVNKALESAGGVWNRKAKAHLFSGDPRPFLGVDMADRDPSVSLAKSTVRPDTPTSYESAAPDPFTGIPSLITGPTVLRDQGRAIAQNHAQRLRAGLRGGEENRDAGPALAADRSRAFVVPVLSAAQMDRLQSLPPIGEGAEAKVYADRANGTVYKVLQGYEESPALGIWPDLFSTADGKLDYTFSPATRPRQLAARLAVQTLLGGTPTEIVGIGPDGHVILKQPLSSMPDIASRDAYIDAGVRTLAKQQAGLVLIPPGMLSDPKAPSTYLAVVEGRPYLVADLVPDNFVGDTQRNARLNDVVVTNLPAQIIPRVKGLAAVVTQAGQEAARLGDRANRLFASAKRVELTRENVFAHRLATAKEEIAADMANGTIPASVRSFAELQDYVDANEYVNDAERPDRQIGPLGKKLEWKNTDYIQFTAELIESLDQWLQTGSPDAAPLAKSAVSPSPSPQVSTSSPSPLAKLGWNHLDRHISAKLAALTRWTTDQTHVGELVAKWGGHKYAQPFIAIGKSLKPLGQGVKRELFPDSVLPREVAARKREMEIKTALGAQRGMDLVRALSGKPKFSDLAYPAEFSQNPMHRRNLYLAMTGEIPMTSLPQALQDLGGRLRDMLVDMGREAVKQGRMSTDTFANLQSGYMPHYYKEDVQREKSILQRFRLGVRDILAQRTTAWHIVDNDTKDKTGEPRLISWQGNQWRFRNKEHRDAFYEDFILNETLSQVQARGGKAARALTLSDLRAPAKLDAELRGRIKEISLQLKMRYSKERPLDIDEQEKAGLIMDPVYAIARYTAQMVHDNSTAEFFNFVAGNKDWTSDTASPGFTEIPDNPRFGRLAGKYVTEDVSRQILEMVEAPNIALQLYDTLLGWWKTGKTVLNPGTHMRNVLGNIFFSQLAGTSVWNPGNVPYYKAALKAMRNGGPDLQEAYEMGVLGADFVSSELRQTLRQLLPDPATIADDGKPDVLLGIGKAIGRVVPDMLKNPLSKGYNQIAALYQAEDELFKLASYLKARAIFSSQSPSLRVSESAAQAAAHVRTWFPYFDQGTSATLKTLGRTAMPFLGFYRESIRIFGNAVKERPIALATGLAVPSLITFLSAMLLGLDDDDLDQVKKDMRGKAGKLLGPTPFEGMPLFSMLLPVRSDTGQVQQFDISAIHPFVDFLGNRVEATSGQDWYQQMWRSMIAAGPIGSLVYSQMTGKDTFGDRTFVEENMTGAEKFAARADNFVKTIAPPLTPSSNLLGIAPALGLTYADGKPLIPGGTGFQTLANAGERSTNKTFETRSPMQAVTRAVVGLDVRNATPDLYRIAEDWRKANGLPTSEGMDFSGSTPVSRARKALFSVLAQDNPNREAIANIKKKLADFGSPIRDARDVQRLLFYKNPLMIISGPENQARFRASLQGLERQALGQSMAEYEKIKAKAPSLLLR
jgi:N12 class adenine-specific DNA methylase